MCIPHAPNNTFKSEKRERKHQMKKSKPFNKKLLEPDLDFKDERVIPFSSKDKPKSLLQKLFSLDF